MGGRSVPVRHESLQILQAKSFFFHCLTNNWPYLTGGGGVFQGVFKVYSEILGGMPTSGMKRHFHWVTVETGLYIGACSIISVSLF